MIVSNENGIDVLMDQIRLVSFISNREEIFASLISLGALKSLEYESKPPIILIDQKLVDSFERDFPDMKLANAFRKLNAQLNISFSKGYNWNLGFRPAAKRLVKLLDEGDKMLYFSPNLIFFNLEILEECKDQFWAAQQPDDYWPVKDLYGPKLEDIWTYVIALGGGNLKDWINEDEPEEYWRRFPAASPHLFYAPDPQGFVEGYSEINESLSSSPDEVFSGQGHLPQEAIISALVAKLDGHIFAPFWDLDVIYYQDFYELMLRINEDHLEWLAIDVLNDPPIRSFLKLVDEYKVIFYQNRVRKIRDSFDDIEKNFSNKRMQMLISRRKIRKKLRARLKREKEENLAANIN